MNKIILFINFFHFLLLIFLFLPDTVRIIKAYSYNPEIISTDIIKQAYVISKIPKDDGVIVVDRIKVKGNYQDMFGAPIISALSGHSIYYENELTEFAGIGKIVEARRNNIDRIEENITSCSNSISVEKNIVNIMRKSNNKYLLVLQKNNCMEKFNKLKVVNEENTSVLYKI